MQVRDPGIQNQTQVAYDESFLGPKGGCVVNEISRPPVPEHQAGRLEGASFYRHALLHLKELRSPKCDPHLGASMLWDTNWGGGAHPTESNWKCPTI